MELFTYLMAKNDHNTSVKKDLFSYLLGKNQSGTYTDYSGTSLSINNTKKGKMKVNLLGNTSQTGTPTPSSPIPVNVVSGDNTINVNNNIAPQSTSYLIHLGEYELCKISTYQDRFFKNIPNTTDYKSNLEDNEWYLEKKIRHLSLAIADMNNVEDYPGWKNVPYIIEDLQGQGYIENLTSFKSNITDKKASIAITTYNNILYLDKNYGFGLTQTQWKTNYPNLIFELYYGLSSPTYIPITGTLKDELEALQKAQSYKGTTNINQINNDLPFNMDVSIKVGS